MSKFETEAQQMSTQALKALQQDLQERVATGKIGFGKRATNILLAAIASAGIGEAASYAQGRFTETYFYNFGDAAKRSNPIGAAAVLANKESREELFNDFSKSKYKKVESYGFVGNCVIQLGGIVTGSMLLNKRSKAKQEEKLSFVETELARREMKTREINEPGLSS